MPSPRGHRTGPDVTAGVPRPEPGVRTAGRAVGHGAPSPGQDVRRRRSGPKHLGACSMDPNTNRGPEETAGQGHPAEAPTPPFGTPQEGSGGQARVVRLVSGGYLVTVNPIAGSEIEP